MTFVTGRPTASSMAPRRCFVCCSSTRWPVASVTWPSFAVNLSHSSVALSPTIAERVAGRCGAGRTDLREADGRR